MIKDNFIRKILEKFYSQDFAGWLTVIVDEDLIIEKLESKYC